MLTNKKTISVTTNDNNYLGDIVTGFLVCGALSYFSEKRLLNFPTNIEMCGLSNI